MIFKCDGVEFDFTPSNRDSAILLNDTNPFMLEGPQLGLWLIESGNLSIVHGFEKGKSWTRPRTEMLSKVHFLVDKLREDEDLLSYNYQFSFSQKSGLKRPSSSGVSGFKIDGLYGSIKSYPRSFLTLQLSETAPSGKARTVRYVDMRNMKSLPTEDWGDLKVHKRKGEFMLLDHMTELQKYLTDHEGEQVEITPKWQRK